MWSNIRLPKEVAREFIGGAEELKRGKTMRAGQRPEAAVAPRSVMIPFASITVSSRVGFAELSAPKKLGTRQRVLSPGGMRLCISRIPSVRSRAKQPIVGVMNFSHDWAFDWRIVKRAGQRDHFLFPSKGIDDQTLKSWGNDLILFG
jgi:hypothetical protein